MTVFQDDQLRFRKEKEKKLGVNEKRGQKWQDFTPHQLVAILYAFHLLQLPWFYSFLCRY